MTLTRGQFKAQRLGKWPQRRHEDGQQTAPGQWLADVSMVSGWCFVRKVQFDWLRRPAPSPRHAAAHDTTVGRTTTSQRSRNASRLTSLDADEGQTWKKDDWKAEKTRLPGKEARLYFNFLIWARTISSDEWETLDVSQFWGNSLCFGPFPHKEHDTRMSGF